MRFILTSNGMEPTDGAIIPYIAKKAQDAATDAASNVVSQWVHDIASWVATDGIVLAAEMALVWGMICFLVAISGTGKWMERGAKSILLCVMLGVVRHAV